MKFVCTRGREAFGLMSREMRGRRYVNINTIHPNFFLWLPVKPSFSFRIECLLSFEKKRPISALSLRVKFCRWGPCEEFPTATLGTLRKSPTSHLQFSVKCYSVGSRSGPTEGQRVSARHHRRSPEDCTVLWQMSPSLLSREESDL